MPDRPAFRERVGAFSVPAAALLALPTTLLSRGASPGAPGLALAPEVRRRQRAAARRAGSCARGCAQRPAQLHAISQAASRAQQRAWAAAKWGALQAPSQAAAPSLMAPLLLTAPPLLTAQASLMAPPAQSGAGAAAAGPGGWADRRPASSCAAPAAMEPAPVRGDARGPVREDAQGPGRALPVAPAVLLLRLYRKRSAAPASVARPFLARGRAAPVAPGHRIDRS